jgi:hypothetical protein
MRSGSARGIGEDHLAFSSIEVGPMVDVDKIFQILQNTSNSQCSIFDYCKDGIKCIGESI